ncbi:sigma-70 family RNA polymerase sigma factor [Lederbergia citri]|uniref:sigma-70 family RNA polymerase sigma factor n=1 Tax=Lederbergia citri TaxID=2833580 RepID=UPI002D7EE532|nr:sigma-70 family RNA polymerase sigma factor [Lederbergia citri]
MSKIINLVKKAQLGDDQAYLCLFQKFEEDIYRTAYVYLKNQEDALDVVQETAYRSFKSIHQLKEPRYFKTWLIKIAISCSIDVLRKRKKVIQLNPEFDEFLTKGENQDISLSLSLKDLIYSLDEDEKGVIILRYYHDYTIKEIAKILGIPLGTGKTILYRALKKLRILLEAGDMNEQ